MFENRQGAVRPVDRIVCLLALLLCGPCLASPIVVDRNGAYVAVESYAPNIVRITIATDHATAAAPPGYRDDATHRLTASGSGKILRHPIKALLEVVTAR